MPGDKGTSGYYRVWCDTLALFYDALTATLGLLVGGEMRFRKKVPVAADLRGGETVLDVGCGTGTLALLMATLVGTAGRVTGIDLSRRMLARAHGWDVDILVVGPRWTRPACTMVPCQRTRLGRNA